MKFLYVGCLLIILFSCSQQKKKVKSYPIQNEISGIKFTHFELFFKAKEQVFQWNTNKDTLLTLEKGTKIFLPKGCVGLIEKNKRVQVKVKECYEISDFIAEKLTTISNKSILETGGMVHVDIEQNGTDLKLNKGAEYQIYFPKNGVQKTDMKTFYGNKNENDLIVWELGKEIYNKKEEKIKEEQVFNDPIEDSLLAINSIDSSTCRIKIGLRTVSISGKKVKWLLKNTGEYLPDYIDKNFNPSEELRKEFCDSNFNTDYSIKYNKDGKVIDVHINEASNKRIDSLFICYLKSLPEVDMSTMPKDNITGYYSLGIHSVEDFNYSNEDFKKKFKEKYKGFNNTKVKKINKNDLTHYVLTSSKLGWINCDRFWETKDEKIDFVVSSSEDLNLNLVFEDINSIMPATKKGNSYVFANVPINRKVKLLGIKFGKGDVQLAINKTVISRNSFTMNSFKDFTLSELEKELNGN